jgi:trehalose 6-phosphate synthase
MSEEDRMRAGRTLEEATVGAGYRVRLLAFEPEDYAGFYDGVSNRVLWFLHHSLWDIPREPTFAGFAGAWEQYQTVNEGFARVLEQEGRSVAGREVYLVQDYHLALVPVLLRGRRREARIAYFSHIPFTGPGGLLVLPHPVREALLAGMLGADVVGFQAAQWAENFLLCCRMLPEARVDLRRGVVRWDGREVRVRVYPISIDPVALREAAASDRAAAARSELARWVDGRTLLLRVDRAELSKNILRGFAAYERFLERNQQWLGRIVFLALLNPSRQHLSEYRAYAAECLEAARGINERFGGPHWEPVRLSLEDDHPRVLAAYGLYDALLVNPVFDGMNLVAKEGPVLNERGGVLILSENAGAFAELGRHAVGVNPFDVEATARAIEAAVQMDPAERRRKARGLQAAVAANPVDRWVHAQVEDLERLPRSPARALTSRRAAPRARPGAPRPRPPR